MFAPHTHENSEFDSSRRRWTPARKNNNNVRGVRVPWDTQRRPRARARVIIVIISTTRYVGNNTSIANKLWTSWFCFLFFLNSSSFSRSSCAYYISTRTLQFEVPNYRAIPYVFATKKIKNKCSRFLREDPYFQSDTLTSTECPRSIVSIAFKHLYGFQECVIYIAQYEFPAVDASRHTSSYYNITLNFIK